ncbi:MAG: SPFH domain-containing protein [Myxococcota bacterium]|jgi:flotillin|nr:SPFH domain-containing protein [Myxococcota bacterium]
MDPIVIIVGVVVIAVLFAAMAIRNVIFICPPNKAIIFSGSRSVGPDGRKLGYRIVQGGRGIRIPLFESFDEIDLSNMIIDVSTNNAYSRGGISLTVHAVANIKVAGMQPRLDNAIQRLLGKSRQEIMGIARETLEGNLRGVLAKLTPEEVNEDRVSFEKNLLEEVDHDLSMLGLALDTLTIQSVSDESGYLASIGRQRNSQLMRDARIAEAKAQAQAAVRDAKNREDRLIAQFEADMRIAQAQAERRISEAQAKGRAMVAEANADIAAQKARAEAELSVQVQRIEQVRRRLMADVLEPAQAALSTMQADAIGQSSSILEDGRAKAEAFRQLVKTWKNAGPHAREIFLGHKLNVLLDTIMSTVQHIEIEKMTVIDARLSAVDVNGSLPMKTLSAVEQLKQTIGLDLADLVQTWSAAKKA